MSGQVTRVSRTEDLKKIRSDLAEIKADLAEMNLLTNKLLDKLSDRSKGGKQ